MSLQQPYTYYTVFKRGAGAGQSFGTQCRMAREMQPESDAMTAQAWTTPRSIRAAGRVMIRGKGPRMDLQDLHSREELAHGTATMMSARDRHVVSTASASNTQMDRTWRSPVTPRRLCADPGPDPGRLNPAEMARAGQPSISSKLDMMREDDYRKERFLAIRDDDRPSAIRR